MKKSPYTIEEAQFLNYIQQKVKDLFEKYPAPAHDLEHVGRVVSWIKQIAIGSKAKSVFMCELAAWLHDIGRTREKKGEIGAPTNSHAEDSYLILKEWFKQDREFDFLTDDRKKELLYSVRYHWNNEANDYDTAWILRDADKLDIMGQVFLDRLNLLFKDDEKAFNLQFRLFDDILHNIRTKTAKKLIKKYKLVEPVEKAYKELLKSKIEPIEL
jgi:HD superfamily phosphodiesterase